MERLLKEDSASMDHRRLTKQGIGVLVLLGSFFLMMPTEALPQPGPFELMSGTWSGGGKVVFSDGHDEPIRCRLGNDVGGAGSLLELHLRCASASYNFEVQSTVAARQGEVSGNWNETSRNIRGQLLGVLEKDRVVAHVEGGAFDADVTLAITGSSLVFTLAPVGTEVREVVIILQRIS
jgi:hypothetical protein